MHIYLAGLNHRTAPIEIREKLAYLDADLPNALKSLTANPGIREAAILSTCNRIELYALGETDCGHSALLDFLASSRSVPDADFRSLCYLQKDAEAASHLYRVASGLDSLVLGEPQVLRQVKQAYEIAMGAGTTGPTLNALFRNAIATGKRARTETEIGKGGFSIGHAAVDLARSIFGDLTNSKVLILGAGKMSELTAKHLQANGIGVIFVANRTFQRAKTLAEHLGGRAIQYDEFPDMLSTADIVISSTASPVHVLTRESIQPALRKRRGRPLFLIDIALPRDISPDIADLGNVFLYDIDDLESVVEDMVRVREGERDKVEAIIDGEVGSFMVWWRSLEAVPFVIQLKEKHEQIRQSELERLKNQLPHLNAGEWDRIEASMRSLVNRISKDPVERLKEASAAENISPPGSLLDAAQTIFGLENAEITRKATTPIDADQIGGDDKQRDEPPLSMSAEDPFQGADRPIDAALSNVRSMEAQR